MNIRDLQHGNKIYKNTHIRYTIRNNDQDLVKISTNKAYPQRIISNNTDHQAITGKRPLRYYRCV